MREYTVTLHDDTDWMYRIKVLAPTEREAREHTLVLENCQKNDVHVVSVRLSPTPSP